MPSEKPSFQQGVPAPWSRNGHETRLSIRAGKRLSRVSPCRSHDRWCTGESEGVEPPRGSLTAGALMSLGLAEQGVGQPDSAILPSLSAIVWLRKGVALRQFLAQSGSSTAGFHFIDSRIHSMTTSSWVRGETLQNALIWSVGYIVIIPNYLARGATCSCTGAEWNGPAARSNAHAQ